MAMRPSNRARNRWTVELLDLQPGDRLLEIGFGPGLAIAAALSRQPELKLTGIDHSAVMLRQASKRNAAAIAAGVVQLHQGSPADLEFPPGSFDKIFSVNVAQFWTDPVAEFTRLRALLRPGGMLVTTYMPRNRNATDEEAERKAVTFGNQLRKAGFKDIVVNRLPLKPVGAIGVIATHD